MISREWTSTSSPAECSPIVLVPMVTFPLELELIMAAWVLALGRVGFSPLLSCRSIRMEITPNVWDDSWYAMRLETPQNITQEVIIYILIHCTFNFFFFCEWKKMYFIECVCFNNSTRTLTRLVLWIRSYPNSISYFSDLGDSPKGIVLMCSFWISSIVPMVRVPSFAKAKLQQ